MQRIETAQTFLTASEIDSLVGDYLAGATVQELAQKYGIHRATVFAHLRRRNTPRRVPGLDVDEKAETGSLVPGQGLDARDRSTPEGQPQGRTEGSGRSQRELGARTSCYCEGT